MAFKRIRATMPAAKIDFNDVLYYESTGQCYKPLWLFPAFNMDIFQKWMLCGYCTIPFYCNLIMCFPDIKICIR
jgi:hypothetical protein